MSGQEGSSVEALPIPQVEGSSKPYGVLSNHPNLLAKQTRKGCIQEMFGCEAQTEFNIATLEKPDDNVFYALEESSCCIRFFCPSVRPLKMNVSANGSPIASFERPCGCPMATCKCCCYQKMVAMDPNGKVLGSVTETFWLCVPGFRVLDQNDSHIYDLHQPTCCGGMCVDFCKEGCCNCRIPFYIYRPNENEAEVGKIVKIWSGMVNELFTDADKFEVEFPQNATAEERANLLGALFLVNILFFESSKQDKK